MHFCKFQGREELASNGLGSQSPSPPDQVGQNSVFFFLFKEIRNTFPVHKSIWNYPLPAVYFTENSVGFSLCVCECNIYNICLYIIYKYICLYSLLISFPLLRTVFYFFKKKKPLEGWLFCFVSVKITPYWGGGWVNGLEWILSLKMKTCHSVSWSPECSHLYLQKFTFQWSWWASLSQTWYGWELTELCEWSKSCWFPGNPNLFSRSWNRSLWWQGQALALAPPQVGLLFDLPLASFSQGCFTGQAEVHWVSPCSCLVVKRILDVEEWRKSSLGAAGCVVQGVKRPQEEREQRFGEMLDFHL